MEQDIRIGTLVQGKPGADQYIRQIIPHGFESFAITFGDSFKIAPEELAGKIMPMLESEGRKIGAISLYCNPLKDDEAGERARRQFRQLIDCAPLYQTDVVSGFTGRVAGASVPDSLARFKEVWTPLAEYAGERGIRIAWENCPMSGNWLTGSHNIAINPAAWELMFEAIPLPNIGLEWEPCHQMLQLIDPMPQLRQWVSRIFHVHGKDATIHREVLAKYGIASPKTFAYHRVPGFGDCNWADIISDLRRGKFRGCIDIEGWHDTVYHDALEMTGQVHGLKYLQFCRGGDYVANPRVEN
ncbi:MAG: sugar phosphate isomerase/epimerase [Oligosphaeraceae bacterium]|nr:sugar phosphate isomerase/epimerase [Oligosphaeraceae bacterium]